MSAIALSASIHANRSAFKDCSSIDLRTYHSAMRHHSRDERIALLRLQAGGHWTDDQQQILFEGRSEAKCFHCSEAMSSIFHLWTCPGLKEYRRTADAELEDAQLLSLPKHLLLGVPNHRSATLSMHLSTYSQEDCRAYWDLDQILDTGIQVDSETKDAFQFLGIADSNLNIQELSYKLLAYHGASPMPRVQQCDGQPPTLPNVFTDGSYLHPGHAAAFATYGAWEPGRSPASFTDEEADFTRTVHLNTEWSIDGVLTAGAIPGVYSSSTRAELASVIAALPKPGPLHFALDNAAVVQGMHAIISGITTSKRPWALRSDGDLWSIAERAVAIRGPNSLAVQWTKGHASASHILDGVSSERNAIGNGMADTAADHGHDVAHHAEAQRVLSHFARTQDAYGKLLVRLQCFALAIIKADKDERTRRDFAPTGKHAKVELIEPMAEPILRPAFENGARLNWLQLPSGLEGTDLEVSVFWQLSFWDPQGHPTTWIELFALFRLWGGGTLPEDNDMHAHTPSLQQRLNTFVRSSKAFCRVHGTEETKHLVQTYQGKELLLSRYGLNLRAPAIASSICLDRGLHAKLHQMLNTIRAIKEGQGSFKLKSSPAPLPFKEPWLGILSSHWKTQHTSIVTIANRRRYARDHPTSQSNIMINEGSSRHTMFMLHCPKCNAAKNAQRCTLYTTHAKVVACRSCSIASASSKWRCIHNVPWLRCPSCRSVGFLCKRKAKPQGATSRRRAHMTSTRIMKKSSVLGGLGMEVMMHNSASGGILHKKKIKKIKKK